MFLLTVLDQAENRVFDFLKNMKKHEKMQLFRVLPKNPTQKVTPKWSKMAKNHCFLVFFDVKKQPFFGV